MFQKLRPDLEGIKNTYGVLFLVVLILFTILFVIHLSHSKNVLLQSQKDIKDAYIKHIQEVDNLYLDILSYNKTMTSNIMVANTRMVSDSLLKEALTGKQLSDRQYNNLSSLLSTYFKEIERCQEQYEAKICRDSLQLSVERCLLEGQTKTMLDLHLNKVEHEYSNITVWAAILTILFLVFSFYSIYKMDELIKQGQEGVNEIRNLKQKGETLVGETNKKVNSFMQDQQNRVNSEIKDMLQKKEDALGQIDRAKQVFDKEVEKQYQKFNDEINNLLEEQNKRFASINEQMYNTVIQLNTSLNNITKDDDTSGEIKEERK